MTLSYAGVGLLEPTPAIEDWIEKNIPSRDVFQQSMHYYAGLPMDNIPLSWDIFDRPTKLNVLYWPREAQKWAWGFFLVDRAKLDLIKAQVYLGGYQKRTLIFGDGVTTLQTDLWMLPPVPLQDGQFYIIPLVDDRFFWYAFDTGVVTIVEGTTNWVDFFPTFGAIVGSTITNDAIPSAYLKPSTAFVGDFSSIPQLLDFISRSVGMRIVRQLNGTVEAVSYQTSATRQASNLAAGFARRAGGLFPFDAFQINNSLPSLVPSSMVFLFPKSDGGTLGNDYYGKSVALTSLSLPEFTGVVGYNGHKTVKMGAIATYAGGATPTNQLALDTLAIQYATDWYRHALGKVDATFNGICNWNPEGLSRAIEWTCRLEGYSTRVYRCGIESEKLLGPYTTGPAGSIPTNINITTIVNSPFYFPIVNNQSATPPGFLSSPTCLGPGPPLWIPPPLSYPSYWNPTTNTLWYWNGTAWVAIGGGGSTSSSLRPWEAYRHQSTAPFAAFNRKRYHVAGTHATQADGTLANDLAFANRFHLAPAIFPGGGTIDRLGIGLAASPGDHCQFAIWEWTGNGNDYPLKRVLTTTEVDLSTNVNRLHYIDLPTPFTPDPSKLYHFGVWFDTNTHVFMISPTVGFGISDLWGYESREDGSFSTIAPEVPGMNRTFPVFLKWDTVYNPLSVPDPFPPYDGGVDWGGNINFFGGDGASNWFPAIFYRYKEPAVGGAGAGGGGGGGGGLAFDPSFFLDPYNRFVQAVADNDFISPPDFQVPL